MIPRFTQLCLCEATALSTEQDVPAFLAEFLMSVCFFRLPFLKKKKKSSTGMAEVTLYKGKVMRLGSRQTRIYIQALILTRCVTLQKWLNLLASVSLSVRGE